MNNQNHLSPEIIKDIEHFISDIFSRNVHFAVDLFGLDPKTITEKQMDLIKNHALYTLSFFYPPECVLDFKFIDTVSTDNPISILLVLDYDIIEKELAILIQHATEIISKDNIVKKEDSPTNTKMTKNKLRILH